ncbi:hypothetical protein EYF80_002630 [Liparis tanakae]|uniref:Uncharacterized protein n=1 Tax=Liparis tanakae TaxID=230148 RepID=A0A4Z2J933_9TELE|nr:hypothetical protein EYF80_002630 [Liparis tanakae]
MLLIALFFVMGDVWIWISVGGYLKDLVLFGEDEVPGGSCAFFVSSSASTGSSGGLTTMVLIALRLVKGEVGCSSTGKYLKDLVLFGFSSVSFCFDANSSMSMWKRYRL